MTGVAAAVVLTPVGNSPKWKAAKLLAGFSVGIFLHGVFDYLPHWHPFASGVDLMLAVAMTLVAFGFTERSEWTLVGACLFGSILPDLIDFGPTMADIMLGLPVPSLPFRVFPWHWENYSGSVYDGSNGTASAVLHISIVAVTGFILFLWPSMFKRNGGGHKNGK